MSANQKGKFTGKVAFITGAASGIGRAAALAFAREGAGVVVADVSEERNQETACMIEEQGWRALAVRCDLMRAEDVKAAQDKTVETFGRLDVAFNNAGVEPKKVAPTAEVEEEEWDLRGANWQDGPVRGDRKCRPLAVFGCGLFCRRPRSGRGWRPDSVMEGSHDI